MKRLKNKKHQHKPHSSKTKTAEIVKVEPQSQPNTIVTASGRVRKLTEDEVALLKRTVAKGTNDDEFAMFLWFCKNHQVDPVAQEVYCIMRWDSKRDVVGQDENNRPIYKGGMKMTIQMGIGGLRGLAARKHKDYGSTDEPVWVFGNRKTPAGRPIPEQVTVAVWKKGAQRPTKATIFWDEFAPANLSEPQAKFWNYSPANQLAKCCESQTLKKAYPDLNNIFIPEEFSRQNQDYTPDGRLIMEADGRTPTGEPARADVQTNRAQQPAIDAEIKRQKEAEKPRAAQPAKRKKIISLEWWMDGKFAAIRGDIEAIIPELKRWQSEYNKELGAWMLPGAYVSDLQASVEKSDEYQLQEIQAKAGPLPKSSPTVPKSSPTQRQSNGEGTGGKPVPPGTTAPSGSIVSKIEHMVSKGQSKKPYVNVFWKGQWHSCWDTTLFEYLDQAKDLDCGFFTKTSGQYTNIVGIAFIGARKFMEGVPVLDANEPRPAPGRLFAQ